MPQRETQIQSVIENWRGVNQRLQPTTVPDGFFTFAKGVYFGLGENATRISGKVLAGKLSAPIVGITVLDKIALLQTNVSLLWVPLEDLLTFNILPTPATTIALVSKTSSNSATTFTTSSIDTSGANLIVACVTFYNSGGASPVITDNKGNTYTALTVHSQGDISMGLVYCATPTVGAGHTFTSTFAGTGYATLEVASYSGANSSPLDQQGGNNTTGSSISTGSLTPSVDNCLVVTGLINRDTTGTPTCTIAIQEVIPFNTGVNFVGGLAHQIQTTATAVNPQWSWSGSFAAATAIAIFKPA